MCVCVCVCVCVCMCVLKYLLGAFSRDSAINLSPQCKAFSRALKTES